MLEALEMTLLLDYYGSLLTERQQACMDLRYNQDMTLGEIAAELGISRQGVHDTLARSEEMMMKLEENLGCVCLSTRIREAADLLLETASQAERLDRTELALAIRSAVARLKE